MEKIRRMFVPEIKAEGDDRSVRVTLSTESIDRDNDRIAADGWELTQFRANPVVCWAHRYDVPAIAKATNIAVKNGKLQATAEFPPEATYDLADTVYKLVREKVIRGVSVGFRPIEYTIDAQRGGYNFARQSLLEFSFCNVPSNADCLVQARALGISEQKLKALGIIDGSGNDDQDDQKEGVVIMLTENKDGFVVDVDELKKTIKQAIRENMKDVPVVSSLSAYKLRYGDHWLIQRNRDLYDQEQREARERGERLLATTEKIHCDWVPYNLPDLR